MSNILWFDELSEAERQNLRNEIDNKSTEGLAVANTDYLLKLIDEHQDINKIREAWNDNFDQWYEIIKKYAKPKNDEYVSCEHLFDQGFWGKNTTGIDLNAIEKHWRGDRSFPLQNLKFILPVKLTGETKLSDFSNAVFSSWAYFKDATFSSAIYFQNSGFLTSPPDFTGVKEFNYLPLFDSGPEALAQQFPITACQSSPTYNEESYRKLKIIAKQHENSELEGFFYRRELLCKYYRLEEQKTDQLIRCGIISYERLFSCGWSMIKPIIGLFLGILLFFFAYSYVINDDFLQTTYVDDDNQPRHALILQIKPSVLAFSFRQALPIVSGLDSLGRTYDEMFPQKRLLNKQCEKQEPSKIATILPQCKIPTALMILAIIHKISSGILIFMFLLALRNNFKMS